jgi:hypothetical protein
MFVTVQKLNMRAWYLNVRFQDRQLSNRLPRVSAAYSRTNTVKDDFGAS